MTPERRNRYAQLVSTVLGPVPMGVVLGVAVGIHSGHGRGLVAGTAWGLLSVVCAAVLPAIATVPLRKREARSNRLRLAYMTPAVVGALVGLLALSGFGAPHDVVVLATGFAAGLVLSTVVNGFYPSSNHVAALTGGAVLAAGIINPYLALVGLPAAGVQAWARVRLGRHSLLETVAGAITGALAAVATLATLG